jgi:hypothetical protein
MADLITYPPKVGDKTPYVPYLSEVQDELWERNDRARFDVKKEIGIDIRVVSGFRPYADQVVLYNCYQNKLRTGICRCGSCNLAAAPGSSNHELGLALDLSPGPRSIKRAKEIYYNKGLVFPVVPEDWHAQLDPNRQALPGQPPIVTPEVTPMSLVASHTINGITLEAEIIYPTIIRAHWNDGNNPVWANADWVLLKDLGVPVLPSWVNHLTVEELEGRFVIVARDTNTHLSWAMYQKAGTSGPPVEWERNLFPAK